MGHIINSGLKIALHFLSLIHIRKKNVKGHFICSFTFHDLILLAVTRGTGSTKHLKAESYVVRQLSYVGQLLDLSNNKLIVATVDKNK